MAEYKVKDKTEVKVRDLFEEFLSKEGDKFNNWVMGIVRNVVMRDETRLQSILLDDLPLTDILVKDIIGEVNPSSLSMFYVVNAIIDGFGVFLTKKGLKNQINNLDIEKKKDLWKFAEKSKRKFITVKEYQTVIQNIRYRAENALYNEALFRSIYEGLYDSKYSILRNLRARDVFEGECVVRTYDIKGEELFIGITPELSRILKGISSIHHKDTKDGRQMEAVGMYFDSCFKIAKVRGGENQYDDEASKAAAFKNTITRNFRDLIHDHFLQNSSINTMSVCVSGVTHRAIEKLKVHGYANVKSEFERYAPRREVMRIVEEEFSRIGIKKDFKVYLKYITGRFDELGIYDEED